MSSTQPASAGRQAVRERYPRGQQTRRHTGPTASSWEAAGLVRSLSVDIRRIGSFDSPGRQHNGRPRQKCRHQPPVSLRRTRDLDFVHLSASSRAVHPGSMPGPMLSPRQFSLGPAVSKQVGPTKAPAVPPRTTDSSLLLSMLKAHTPTRSYVRTWPCTSVLWRRLGSVF